MAYGVKAEHFNPVGQALLKTLEDHGTPPDELALLQTVYQALASHMIAIAYPDAT